MADKAKDHAITHMDTIEQVPTAQLEVHGGDAEIIRNLETQGSVVGMTWRSAMAAFSMAMSYNAYVITLLIPPAILTYINTDLGPEPTFAWITISWNLGGAIFVTIGGRLSDILGRRYFFLSGAILLVIGSIVGATGQSIGQMIASGAIFGMGSGFLEVAYGAVQEIVPNEWRMVTIGLFDAAAIVAQTTPLMAWAIIKYTQNWRNAYYVIIALEVATVAILFFFYHPPSFKQKHQEDGRTAWQVLRAFDWTGLTIFTIGCTLFIIGINWGGSLHPWVSAATLAPIIIGICMLIGLGFYEAYANLEEPLLPPRLFKEFRHFILPIVVSSVAGMQYYSSATLWSRLSQLIYAHDEIAKGLYAEIIPLGSILGGLACTGSKKLGYQRWQVVFCICLQTACVGAMATSTIDNPAKSLVLTFFISITVTIIIMNCFVMIGFGIYRQEDIGTGVGLAGTSRLLFGAVAIAIFSNVTNSKYASTLPGQVRSAIEGMGFPTENVTSLVAAARLNTAAAYAGVGGVTPEVQAAATLANKQAYLEGAHLSYMVALAFGLLAVLAAIGMPDIDERKYNKRTVAVQQADMKHQEEKKADQS